MPNSSADAALVALKEKAQELVGDAKESALKQSDLWFLISDGLSVLAEGGVQSLLQHVQLEKGLSKQYYKIISNCSNQLRISGDKTTWKMLLWSWLPTPRDSVLFRSRKAINAPWVSYEQRAMNQICTYPFGNL